MTPEHLNMGLPPAILWRRSQGRPQPPTADRIPGTSRIPPSADVRHGNRITEADQAEFERLVVAQMAEIKGWQDFAHDLQQPHADGFTTLLSFAALVEGWTRQSLDSLQRKVEATP